jgi:hypothetical protein
LTTSLEDSLYLELVESLTYRDFLRIWMSEGGRNGSKISYGEAAKRCGFKSRSYLSDLVHERRALSAKGLEQILVGLSNLPDLVIKCFQHLVFLEEIELRPDRMTKEKILSKLKVIRQRSKRLFTEESKLITFDSLEALVTNPNFHLCYAALGLDQSGESIRNIALKTGLSSLVIHSLLAEMCRKGFATVLSRRTHDEDLYIACDAHRVLESLTPNKAFHAFMINWLSFLLSKIEHHPPKKTDLYNLSTFRINSSDQSSLRHKIVNAVDSIVEDFESAKGDSLVSLSVFYLADHSEK